MYDDGEHQDGTAGDHVYGAQIPALPAGTTVKYYITATDSAGLTTTDPAHRAQLPVFLHGRLGEPEHSRGPRDPRRDVRHGRPVQHRRSEPSQRRDPLHTVTLDGFDIGKFDITDQQYCDYLNSALSQGLIQVTSGLVYGAGSYGVGSDLYAETRQGQLALYASSNPPLTTPYSGISWNGSQFSVLAGDQNMPMVGVYWDGAVAYCNWLSTTEGYQSLLHLQLQRHLDPPGPATTPRAAIACPPRPNGNTPPTAATRIPTTMYPWGNDANTDGIVRQHARLRHSLGHARRRSTRPGAVYPWTTPVGFYNGTLQQKSDFNWPGSQTSYQTSNAVNGYGLYDMAGDVWQWTNDWYRRRLLLLRSVTVEQPHRADHRATLFGTPAIEYHTLRGGS